MNTWKKNVEELKLRILEKIRPSKEEKERVREFVRNIIRIAKIKSGLNAVVVGSIGKGTWLSGDHDIDLFLLFPKSTSRGDLETRGLGIGKEIVKEMKGEFEIKYAEHPYVHASIEGFEVDIVPSYAIEKGEHIKSAVDRSPLHLNYILNNLDRSLIDDVRLLKQFMKGIGIYGSEAKTLGFSGYVCELLILRYGTFEDVVKSASKWQAPAIVDIKYKVKKDVARKRFPDQPLIIIDPVDRKRNAAANINAENFIRFVVAAKKFMQEPNKEYFFPPPPQPLSREEINKLKKRKTKFIAITMPKPELMDDILYPQLRKMRRRIEGILKENEFVSLRSYEWVGKRKLVLVYELEIWSLPDIKKMIGPFIFSRKHTKEFLTKYAKPEYGPYVEKTTWVVERDRKYKDATSLLEHFLSKDVKEMKMSGIPTHLCNILFNSRLLEHHEFWNFVKKNNEFSAFLRSRYFERLRI